ncbi:DUF1800 family protein [Fluviicola sp.]|uniref:DUF1800 domain-containing protein n=1 Tax=Fluviicola sp. TaxID=1917219 RepID=UPI002619760E|nr:DUF1800 family protein [Fluviicola sp.]
MASLNPITGALGEQKAAHLLRRATLGPRLQDISNFSGMTAQAAFTALSQSQTIPPLPIDPLNGTDWVYPNTMDPNQFGTTLSDYTRSWWLENMRASEPNLTERMIWFYHTHFPMIMSRIEGNPQFALDYLRLLRFYALGNYKNLTKAICIDNAMLIHLDGNLNIKGVPQENFAREFLELFTVGKGEEVSLGNYTNFTEDDVKALTKALTGWGIDPTFQTIDLVTTFPTGKVKGNVTTSSQHDVGSKQFSGAFNNAVIQTGNVTGSNAAVTAVYTELDDVINMIFNSPHTAKHICRRIYREFAYYEITTEIETDIIEPLATVLVNNNFDILPVLEVLFQSEHFYDLDTPITEDNNIGAIIKSPVDLVIGTIRLFNLTVPDKTTQLPAHYDMYSQLIGQLSLQGIELFEPYDVAGYEPYFQYPDFHRYWISSNYLANRYKFSELLISGFTGTSGVLLKLDIVDFVETNCSNPGDPTILVQELVKWLFPITLDTARFNYFRDTVLLDQLSAANWTTEWNNYVNTSSDVNVRLQLESLAMAMMQSPEYQLF